MGRQTCFGRHPHRFCKGSLTFQEPCIIDEDCLQDLKLQCNGNSGLCSCKEYFTWNGTACEKGSRGRSASLYAPLPMSRGLTGIVAAFIMTFISCCFCGFAFWQCCIKSYLDEAREMERMRAVNTLQEEDQGYADQYQVHYKPVAISEAELISEQSGVAEECSATDLSSRHTVASTVDELTHNASPRHHAIGSPRRHGPSHRHHGIGSPHHHGAGSPHHHGIESPHYNDIDPPYRHGTSSLRHYSIGSPHHHGIGSSHVHGIGSPYYQRSSSQPSAGEAPESEEPYMFAAFINMF